jgi:hypothetical protein
MVFHVAKVGWRQEFNPGVAMRPQHTAPALQQCEACVQCFPPAGREGSPRDRYIGGGV